MTTETLHDTLSYIVTADRDFQLQASLQSVSTSLTSLVQTQHSLRAAGTCRSYDRLRQGNQRSERRSHSVSYRTWRQRVLRSSIVKRHTQFDSGQRYDSLCRQQLCSRQADRTGSVSSKCETDAVRDAGAETFRSVAPAGYADITFVIPRSLFDDQLEPFAKELTFISRLVKDVGEAGTGSPEAPVLESLSSSTPTVAILAGVGAIKTIAEAVKAFLGVWKQVQELRDTRNKITELGLSRAAVAELDDRITEVVEQVVETTTTTSIDVVQRRLWSPQ